jgi:heparan-alpha-glucosaminide N-acetyltransferase
MNQPALTETVPPREVSVHATPSTPTGPMPGRLTSMDAYRGFVMALMMGEVLHFGRVAANLPDSQFWKFLAHHQSHVSWIGCSLHDLIQPSFSFLVGVALPFSLASRAARGQSKSVTTLHVLWRALALVLLGVFLRSVHRPQTNWTFEDTLSQIGLGYPLLYLIANLRWRDQWIAFALLEIGYWLAFALYPLPGPGFDYASVDVQPGWPHLMNGFAAHWNKNSNLAWAFDTWFLNLFPRAKPFVDNDGGYATLSFIPTLATMVLGLFAGRVLRDERPPLKKIRFLMVAGLISLVAGEVIGWLGICPVVKRIWTPSWVLFSGGWCFLLLAGAYTIIDYKRIGRWAFPLVVVGMNSIAAYCIAHLFEDFVQVALRKHIGKGFYLLLGKPYEPFVFGLTTLFVFWLMLYWMYRKKIFIRI